MLHRLSLLGLDTSRPGFYDQPAFLLAEKKDPTLLEAYAAFVRQRSPSSEYLGYARERVRASAKFLVDKLKRDGRAGACVDMSQVMSRFLERQGVWNYLVTGCVRLTFAEKTGISPKHFWNITVDQQNGAVAAHVWLCAPPFKVVDLTLRFQPYGQGEQRYLPQSVLAEEPVAAIPKFDDFADSDVVASMRHRLKRPPVLGDIKQISPGILERVAEIGAWQVDEPNVSIKYVGCGISAPDGPLETADNLVLSGRRPIQLWKDFQQAHRPPSEFKTRGVKPA